MASLLGEQLFQKTSQGPPPCNDFFQLQITKNQVILRRWNVSLRSEFRGAPPTECKASHEDFLHHKELQHTISAVFGKRILDYSNSLCHGMFDYLERLPDGILLRLLSFLQLRDISSLAQLSQRFRVLCNCNQFWEQIVRTRCPQYTPEMEELSIALGWRLSYFTFFHTITEN